MALAHHDAAQGDQAGGADPKFFSAQHRRDDDVAAGAHAAVRAQAHEVAQAVEHQHLVGFGQAQLPRRAGELDGRLRRRPRAALVAGDQDVVGLGLGHAGGDGADAGHRHQLDRDLGVRVDLLQVVDQLGQVFDRVDVVVRRRRDEGHAGRRVTQTCNHLGHLEAGQLAAFAGLGALGDLDLQFHALVQVLGGHAEAARGDLLDGRVRVVAVGQGLVARAVLAALARHRLGADAVHGDVERAVGLGAERAQRHAGGDEALADLVDALDFVQRDRGAIGPPVQELAQLDRAEAAHAFAVALVAVVGAGVAGVLQGVDETRFKRVRLARAAGLVEAADRDGRGRFAPRRAVHLHRLLLQTGQADAGDARGHAGEELRRHGARQADGLEVVAAAIGRNHRDAHLGQDLQQARLDGALVVEQQVAQRQIAGQAPLHAVLGALLSEVGVNGGSAHADQHREVVGVQALGRAHDQRHIGAQALAHEVGVHPAGGEDHRRGQTVGPAVLVGQHDGGAAAQGRVLRLGADAFERRAQGVAVAGLRRRERHGAVDHRHALGTDVLHDPLVHAVGQHRAFQHVDVGLGLVLGQDVAEVLEAGLQAHHPRLAQRVDRRVGHLAEVLAEEVRQRPVLVRQHRKRRVVAHRADGFLAVLDHGREHHLQVLQRHAGGDLTAQQLLALVHARLRARADLLVQRDHVAEPLRIGVALGQQVDDLAFLVELALQQVDREHAAGRDVLLARDAGLGHAGHAGFRTHDDQAVLGVGHAQRAQAVAVLAGHDPAAVGGADRRRTVPRLHHRVAVGVERLVLRVGDRVRMGPRFGQQQGLDHGRVTSGAHQHFEGVVERRGIGAARLDHRLHVLAEIPEGLGGHADLVALHPVGVALQRVDLAVVGDHAEGLGQAPFGEGVGRIALVEDGDGGREALVAQVGVELVDVLGQEHALVDQRPGRQGADVERADAGRGDALLDALAAQEQRTLQRLAVHAGGRGKHDLLDLGTGGVGLLADDRGVDRHLAPAVDVEAEAQHLALDDGAAQLLGAEVDARQEDLAHGDGARAQLVAGAADLVGEEVLGHGHEDAGAVAGLAVGVHGPAVPERLQRLDRQLHHLAARLAVDGADEADAAGVALRSGVVGAAFDEPLAVLEVALHLGVVGHGGLPGKTSKEPAPRSQGPLKFERAAIRPRPGLALSLPARR